MRGGGGRWRLRVSAAVPLDRTLTYRLHLVNKLTDKASADSYAQELRLPMGQARCLAAVGHFAPLSVVELAARANLAMGRRDGPDRPAQCADLRVPHRG
jgi:hypothetical protein